MANQVQIDFNNDFATTDTGPFAIAAVNGTITVDYDTMTVTGSLTTTTSSSTTQTFTAFGITYNQSLDAYQIYAFAGNNDYLQLDYTGQQPSTSQIDLIQGGTEYTAPADKVQSTPVCFASGTLIRTVRGDVPVEDLLAGDVAVTVSGEHRPIRWIGHRAVDCRRHPAPETVMPVRIAAGAFGHARPARDLFVSPGHALCVDLLGEVLIPAAALVNGATIAQVDVDTVTYWHVELDSHDVLIAENMPAESYLDMGNKAFFVETNVVSLAALTPDAPVTTHADFCRPFLAAGPIVDLVRARLRERAVAVGWRLAERDMDAIHLVADGRIVRPDVDGLSARFVLPADAADVWLVSDAGVPSQLGVSLDDRRLGVCLSGLSVDDGLAPRRTIAPDDRRLAAGFHECEDGARRWTSGRARLPATLWEGCHGRFFLRIDLETALLPRWIAPAADGQSLPESNVLTMRAAG